MEAPFELNEGRARLEKIISDFPADSPHWNEAQNRFQFIDRLLVECLGWEKPFISVEHYDESGGRADYILGKNPPSAVLEAKREASYFKFPPSAQPNGIRKLEPLIEACPVFKSTITQVIPYCAMIGAPLAIVCNGPQLAIFQAQVIGYPPLEGDCFIFNGFQNYLSHFPQLWSLLSPEGIGENRAYRDLSLHRNPRIPPKASIAIPEPMRYRYRSDFQENLRNLSSLLLEELGESDDLKESFYKECYVPIDANNRHLLLSKKIISERYKRVGADGIAPLALDKTAKVDEKGNLQINDEALLTAGATKPIVVVGDVGVGKTSFFENLYEQLDVGDKAGTYFIHINLGFKANLSLDLKQYVISEIASVLNHNYSVDIHSAEFAHAIYHSKLVEFDKSVRGSLKNIDPTAYEKEKIAYLMELMAQQDRHLHAALAHLAHGRSKQIILVIDNADQRNFEIQQDAFLIGQELAATKNMLVFVALRPSTFFLSKNTGALSGYQNKVFTISPPPADEVLIKRISFALRVAEGQSSPERFDGIRLRLVNIVYFLKATLRAIRSNDSIKQFLSNITGGNTRSVIELITGFCGSPNVDSEKIVKIESEEGDYKIPLHEFTKHALLGEYAYFNPLSSFVGCNIFDVSSADFREHFLSSLIIAFLSSNNGVRDNDGFVKGQHIISECSGHGFLAEQTRAALRRLATKRLIETPHAHYREVSVPDHELPEQFHFRATSIGIYHIRYWAGTFTFLDAVSIDTPIFDPTSRGDIHLLASSFDINDRLKRSNIFRGYLKSQWQQARIVANYYDFDSALEIGKTSFEQVERFVTRMRGGFVRRLFNRN
ncbi:MAG TPA: hypothetical protein VNQ34_11660 [Xanthobacteraceae bacterium]|nr:hypothetical protein [Xanthobacteraceae bacterium]